MSDPYAIEVHALAPGDIIPGRFGEHGLRELVGRLGGTDDADRDAWELLRETFERLDVQTLGERLLDAVLLDPPIPAYCETMIRRMMDPNDPPWVDYEIAEDRFNLWYCHYLVHRCFPDRWPAPAVVRVALQVDAHGADARPPGRRSPPGDRIAFAARMLRARGGDNPIAVRYGAQPADASEWCFDVVWAAEVANWQRLAAEEAAAAGVADGQPAVRVVIEAWMPPQWDGDLAVGQRWTAAG